MWFAVACMPKHLSCHSAQNMSGYGSSLDKGNPKKCSKKVHKPRHANKTLSSTNQKIMEKLPLPQNRKSNRESSSYRISIKENNFLNVQRPAETRPQSSQYHIMKDGSDSRCAISEYDRLYRLHVPDGRRVNQVREDEGIYKFQSSKVHHGTPGSLPYMGVRQYTEQNMKKLSTHASRTKRRSTCTKSVRRNLSADFEEKKSCHNQHSDMVFDNPYEQISECDVLYECCSNQYATLPCETNNQQKLKRSTTRYSLENRENRCNACFNMVQRSQSLQISPFDASTARQRFENVVPTHKRAKRQSIHTHDQEHLERFVSRSSRVDCNIHTNNNHTQNNRQKKHNCCDHQQCKIQRLKHEYKTKVQTKSHIVNATFTISSFSELQDISIGDSVQEHYQHCYQDKEQLIDNSKSETQTTQVSHQRSQNSYNSHIIEKFMNSLSHNSLYAKIQPGYVEIDATGPLLQTSAFYQIVPDYCGTDGYLDTLHTSYDGATLLI